MNYRIEQLEKMVDKLILRDKVHFTGFVSEPEKLWSDCDVFFFPIRWQEPFGLVGLEALAHGVPVVAFDLGGVREYLDLGECGVLIPERNISAAAKKLEEFYTFPTLLQKAGENGLRIVKENFSEDNFVDNFKKIAEGIK